jgi:competence protein ComFB
MEEAKMKAMEYTFRKKYDFGLLVNEAERLVFESLERQLQERAAENICTCSDCVIDMAAFALNMLKPVYRVSLLGTMYASSAEESSYAKEVNDAVKHAIDRVHFNPSHD